MARSSILWLTISVLVATSCGGTRAAVVPGFADANQGRIVEAVVLGDGRSIVFDSQDMAGPETDLRARVHGDSVQGTVEGLPMKIALDDIKEVVFGVSPPTTERIVVGIAFAAVAVAMIWLLVFANTFEIH